jgi:O-acetyl-ADP-ribose deacetylase (regulator of RNase III)
VPLKVQLKQGSLTDGDELVLVNASNTNAQLGTGVSGAIRAACGPEFQKHIVAEMGRQKGGPMTPGDLFITDAGAHPRAKYVAHVAVMDYRFDVGAASYPTPARIRTACERLWEAIELLPADGPISVAMVALGAGTGNLGVREPTRIAAETLKAHFAIFPNPRIDRVCFYGYQPVEHLAMAAELSRYYPEVLEGLSSEQRAHVDALLKS